MLSLPLSLAEWVQQILCRQGALPVLTLLLESPDSEVQVNLTLK